MARSPAPESAAPGAVVRFLSPDELTYDTGSRRIGAPGASIQVSAEEIAHLRALPRFAAALRAGLVSVT